MISSQQRGIALLTVLLILALATVASVTMTSRQQLDIRRTANMLSAEQGYLVMMSFEEFARRVLVEDTNNTDSFEDRWALVDSSRLQGVLGFVPELAGFKVSEVRIEDLQGRFNVNNLFGVDPGQPNEAVERFRRLLSFPREVGTPNKPEQLSLPPELVNQTIDWLDNNGLPSGVDGADDSEYLGLNPPYLAANRMMTSASEMFHLLRLRSFDENNNDNRGYRRLLGRLITEFRELIALPRNTPINVNTVNSPDIFRAIVAGLSEQDASALHDRVFGTGISGNIASLKNATNLFGANDFADVNEFLGHAHVSPATNINAMNFELGVTSEYFMLTIEVQREGLTVYMNSILHRTGANNARRVNVIHRSLGRWGVI